MGSGKGADLPLIMKICALISCLAAAILVAVATTGDDSSRTDRVSISFINSTGACIIFLGFCFIWTLIKDPVDKTWLAIMLIIGGIATIIAGILVIVYYVDYKNSTHDYQLVGGILSLAAGVVMVVDAAHNFGAF